MGNLSPGPSLGHVITTPVDRAFSGRRTRLEAQIARELGFKVDMITGWGPGEQSLITQPLLRVNYYRLQCLTKYIYPHQDLLALVQLYRLFRRRNYQIIHTHLAKAGILGRLAAGWARIPVVVHDVHGPSFSPAHPWPRRLLYVTLERLAGRFTTHYVFYTNHLKAAYEAQGIGLRASKEVIYPGLDLNRFLTPAPDPWAARVEKRAAWGLKPDDVVVGYVARMVPSKAHHLAIRAAGQLAARYPRLRLLLVGGAVWPEEEKYLKHLKDLVASLGLTGKVIFAGHQAQVLPFYRMFDLFVLPSLYEGTANVMLEALVAGLPVVAFDIPAVRELCPKEVIACPWGDAGGLARGLEQAINARVPGQGDGLPFRQRLVEKFSPARWEENFVAFYRKLMLALPGDGPGALRPPVLP